MQQTFASTLSIQGIGLHSGRDITLTLRPAPVDSGITFIRTDLSGDNEIPARWDSVVDTQLCTVIGNKAGATVGTIEHLMAALRGCYVDNAIIEVSGPEVPAMDGSSAPFVSLIDKAGIQRQSKPRRFIQILKSVEIEDGDKKIALSPAANGSRFAAEIDFDHPMIGRQRHEIGLVNGFFRHELAHARTFGFLKDVNTMKKNGLALGGSLENAIVLDESKVINGNGLRCSDEFIRHKLLDAVGDIYLAGAQIIGEYDSVKPSHELNNRILHKLFATEGAWAYTKSDAFTDVAATGTA